MGRRRAREFALQALYQADLSETSASDALAGLWSTLLEDTGLEGQSADSEEVEFTRSLVAGVEERSQEVDTLIEAASLNWRLSRMPTVDRNILRLATYELLASADVPASVSINEAVELAKRFGEKESGSFVNGILDRIAQETGRGGRGKKRSKGSKGRKK